LGRLNAPEEEAMRNRERGDGKIGLIVMILILAAAIFVLVKVVPARINAYEFKDYMETYARAESWTRTPEQIQKDLLEKAHILNLPITAENLTINKGGGSIEIIAKFDVPVDLKVHKLVLHYDFRQTAERY
jgi:hypothetical protein